MTQAEPPSSAPLSSADDRGRASALIVYALYLLSIPSFGGFALLGVIWALVAKDSAGSLARSHLNDQVRIWWVVFLWAIGLALLWLVGLLLTIVLIGFAVWWLIGIVGFLVAIWFTIKSILGLLALLDGRPR